MWEIARLPFLNVCFCFFAYTMIQFVFHTSTWTDGWMAQQEEGCVIDGHIIKKTQSSREATDQVKNYSLGSVLATDLSSLAIDRNAIEIEAYS